MTLQYYQLLDNVTSQFILIILICIFACILLHIFFGIWNKEDNDDNDKKLQFDII